MSTSGMVIEDLEILFTLTAEPRPSCFLPECSNEALWNIFWEQSCSIHLGNPTPYCNDHKVELEAKIALSLKGFKCRLCAREGGYQPLGQVVKIERIIV